jgi:hypothetical protein
MWRVYCRQRGRNSSRHGSKFSKTFQLLRVRPEGLQMASIITKGQSIVLQAVDERLTTQHTCVPVNTSFEQVRRRRPPSNQWAIQEITTTDNGVEISVSVDSVVNQMFISRPIDKTLLHRTGRTLLHKITCRISTASTCIMFTDFTLENLDYRRRKHDVIVPCFLKTFEEMIGCYSCNLGVESYTVFGIFEGLGMVMNRFWTWVNIGVYSEHFRGSRTRKTSMTVVP